MSSKSVHWSPQLTMEKSPEHQSGGNSQAVGVMDSPVSSKQWHGPPLRSISSDMHQFGNAATSRLSPFRTKAWHEQGVQNEDDQSIPIIGGGTSGMRRLDEGMENMFDQDAVVPLSFLRRVWNKVRSFFFG